MNHPALRVVCPKCLVRAGLRCTQSPWREQPHPERIDAAMRVGERVAVETLRTIGERDALVRLLWAEIHGGEVAR